MFIAQGTQGAAKTIWAFTLGMREQNNTMVRSVPAGAQRPLYVAANMPWVSHGQDCDELLADGHQLCWKIDELVCEHCISTLPRSGHASWRLPSSCWPEVSYSELAGAAVDA